MNRWTYSALMGLIATLMTAACPPVQAQSSADLAKLAKVNTPLVRPFPPNTRRAQMTVLNAWEVTLNGTRVRLAPGARIRSTTNAILLSSSVAGQSFLVNYTLDTLGQPLEIWVLTEAEAAQRLPGSEGVTTTNIVTETAR